MYKNTTLSLNEKSKINKILQKEELTESDKKELTSKISKLPIEDLISLLMNDVKILLTLYLNSIELNNFFGEKLLLIIEMISIILGDGHISLNYIKSRYSCEIALNSDEIEYVNYVRNLLRTIFNVNPSLNKRDSDNTTLIRVFKKEIIEFLIKLGLIPGNKVENQVGIPKWIKNLLFSKKLNQYNMNEIKKNIAINCLRGLIDTDGCIYLSWYKKKDYLSLGIKFTNASKRLVQDFRDICKILGFNFSKISVYIGTTKNGTKYIGYSTNIESKSQVKRFIQIIKPIKWKIKKKLIEERLREFGLTIDEILKYKRYTPDFKNEKAIYFKILYEELGNYKKISDFLFKLYKLPIKKETIAKYVKKLFQSRDKSYEEWLSFNSGIIIDERVAGSVRIPLKIKKLICHFVFKILKKSKLKIDDKEIIKNLVHFIKISNLSRLNYLLNSPETQNKILDFLQTSIIIVRYIINHVNNGYSSTRIKEDIERINSIRIPYHQSQISEIIKEIFES